MFFVIKVSFPAKTAVNPPCLDFFWNSPIAKSPALQEHEEIDFLNYHGKIPCDFSFHEDNVIPEVYNILVSSINGCSNSL